jgi:hypothetical protein
MGGVPEDEITAHDFVMVRAALVQRLGGANEALVWTRIHFRCADGAYRHVDGEAVAWWPASSAQISAEVGLSEDQVDRALRALRSGGFLESTEHRLGGNYDRTKSWRPVVSEPRGVDSADSRNGAREIADRTPRNRGQEPANSRNVPSTKTEKTREDRTRAHALPDSFVITEEMRAWARAEVPAVDVDRAFAEWADYWRGVGKPMKNWTAAWRNGMRKQQTFAERDGWKPRPVSTNATEELLAEQKAAWCAAHGVTVAEWDARQHDEAWKEQVIARG